MITSQKSSTNAFSPVLDTRLNLVYKGFTSPPYLRPNFGYSVFEINKLLWTSISSQNLIIPRGQDGVIQRYSRRCGIENSYKTIKDFSVRLFYFGFAELL